MRKNSWKSSVGRDVYLKKVETLGKSKQKYAEKYHKEYDFIDHRYKHGY